ncbi:MAG: aspartate-semialdehyde dehydrogenase [Clostridiales bacterium]|jgi:aspartate-semialdehyde dehydrogenase|nr:aspartate-semialdehyde dehydrogenase [Clostridiales bacterium]HOK81234.1 aspartate-semialdehyde dehydrogenase [Clostridia bacterium]HOL60353.1 aspartate-semialdehyde dehydrogenase [Clostridia bacterium]HPO53110.1 aspartate-semialdehyde dehydrogenase [Clostridia bacterium]
MKHYNLAVVGATGMVGNKFLQVLEERKLPIENYYLFASAKSAGKVVNFMGKDHTVIELKPENIVDKKIDFAIFSAGASVSKIYAPIFAEHGAIVVDNSSQWRMDPEVPLVVPEVNGDAALNNKGIIANPNCSTIQAVVALKPLYDKYGIKRIVYSTYQAVSGAGVQGYDDLRNGINGEAPKKFPYPIFGNVIPHIDVFMPSGYTKEEEKMINETRKILNDYDLKITATTVRVPVFHGHSESINIEFKKPCTLEGIREALENAPGVIVMDDTANLKYPMPIYAEDHDEVYIGRIRLDFSVDSGCNLWVVADNIRKGAATNTIQIVEYLINKRGE